MGQAVAKVERPPSRTIWARTSHSAGPMKWEKPTLAMRH